MTFSRSNEMISGWSSQHFYSGLLSADPGNASISLGQLIGNTGQFPGFLLEVNITHYRLLIGKKS